MSISYRLFRVSFAILLFLPVSHLAAEYELVWSDEFSQADGSAPDPSNWVYDTGFGGWGNDESQYYTTSTENSRIENGHLVIEMHDISDDPVFDPVLGRDLNYSSARLKTKDRHAWTYGRIEARIRLPFGEGSGLWPAFWMLGSDIDQVGWPQCGEIDIMEYISRVPTEIFGTIHGPGYAGGASFGNIIDLGRRVAPDTPTPLPDLTDPQDPAYGSDFHVYTVEWEPNEIRWYMDGTLYHTATPADVSPNQWVFDHDHFILLNMAIGGNFGGSIETANLTFPTQMLVDYVRVYQEELIPEMTLTTEAVLDDQNSNGFADAGETIRYDYTLTNTGNVTLTRLTLTDSLADVPGGEPVNLLENGDFETGVLAPWETFGGTGVVSAGSPLPDSQPSSFALETTGSGGYAVPQVFQSFPAAPGDEFNLSGYMRAPAGLPAGNTFGTLKIVFRDASEADLEPASVSSGRFAPAANPGAESLPTLTAGSDGWVSTEAQAVAPAGTEEVIFFVLNVDESAGTMVFDGILAFDLGQHGAPSLAAGASDSSSFAGTYTLTESDLLAGSVTAAATADSAETDPVSVEVTTVLPLNPGPVEVVVANAGDSGTGSLRDAIASAAPGSTITFDSALDGQAIILTSGQIVLAKDLTIDGSALPGGVTVSGGSNGDATYDVGETRHFEVAASATATLKGLNLVDGFTDFGGSISNAGALIVEACTFSGNTASVNGGAINVAAGAEATIVASTFVDNDAADGGAIALAGTVTVSNSTFTGNVARGSGLGGALFNFDGNLTIGSATIVGNAAGDGGGVRVFFGGTATPTLQIDNSIVADNTATTTDPNVTGETGTGNLIGTGALLAPLGHYGGPTAAMPPLPGSPAIDAGGTTPFIVDQRGFVRVRGSAVDIGAVESGSWLDGGVGSAVEVTTGADEFNGLDTNGISLREAVGLFPPGSTIRFGDIPGNTVVVNQGLIEFDRDVTIDGSDHPDLVTLDAESANIIFYQDPQGTPVDVTLKGLRLVNGMTAVFGPASVDGKSKREQLLVEAPLTEGGAIYFGSGILVIELCEFTGNVSEGGGSAIHVVNAATTISRSTIHGNYPDFASGAVYNEDSPDFLIINSTIAGNGSTFGSGGGVYTLTGTTTIMASTISGNDWPNASGGAGVSVWAFGAGSAELIDSVVSGNTTASGDPDLAGAVTVTNSLIGGEPQLRALGYHGGPLPTMPPEAGSPTVDAGPESPDSSVLPYDQRLLPRLIDGNGDGVARQDLGAVETLEGARVLTGDLPTGYDFSGVSLSGADVRGTDLSGVMLAGADLSGAIYSSGTQFPSAFNPEFAGMLGLFSGSELDAIRTTARDDVINDPGFYGLYDAASIQDLAVNRILLQRDPGTGEFVISFSVEISPDFVEVPYIPLPYANAAFSEETSTVEVRFPALTDGLEFYRLNFLPE